MISKLKKQFKKEIREFEKIRIESVRLQNKYDDAKLSKKEQKSTKLKDKLDEIKSIELEFVEVYAKKVFDQLSVVQPLLIRRRDKVEVEWIDAFGADFNLLSVEVKYSLIALVEESGGQYRIK